MNSFENTKRRQCNRSIGAAVAVLGAALAAITPATVAQKSVESLERPAGPSRVEGRIAGSVASGFAFVPADGSARVPLEPGSIVHCNWPGPSSSAGDPLFRVLIGDILRLSGLLRAITTSGVRMSVGWQASEVVLPRPGVQAVLQRPGVAQVFVDNFETLEPSRWSMSGKVSLVDEPHASERRSLRIPAGGASLVHNLEEPLSAGRLDLAFHDDALVSAGQKWSIDLTFRGPVGPSLVRVVPGWSDESVALESPSGPALPVQRLARSKGWHRFALQFGPEKTEISVDGKDLAHGRGPEGPLISIGLTSWAPAEGTPALDPSRTPACHIDDLQLVRFAEPPASYEMDITQDEARLVVGDQLFGGVVKADSLRVAMTVLGEAVSLPWAQLAGIHFRRVPAQGAPVEGLLARVEWRSAPGGDSGDLDYAEGAITAVSDRAITLATPYSGILSIPRPLLRRLLIQGTGRRYVIDATAHHLGDEISISPPVLNPPEPEGGVLERSIELAEAPGGPWFLVLDVVQVVDENNDDKFSARVRNGEFRTNAIVNGQRIDYVNRHIKTKNETPERVTMAIPAGLLHPGKNTIRLELTGAAEKDTQLDDLGVLQMALDLAKPTAPEGSGAQSVRP
jgi:hypothetical protein